MSQLQRVLHHRHYVSNASFITPILLQTPGDGHWSRLVGLLLHLLYVPVRLQVGGVADLQVSPYSLHFLRIPEGEGIVVPIAVDDSIRLATIEVVISRVGCEATSRAIVIVPVLPGD